jgi:hypothetical protein
MISPTRPVVSYSPLVILAAFAIQTGPARAQTAAPKLDDATIVAILDHLK